MKRLGQTLLALAVVVMVSGLATCFMGPEFELAKLSAAQRARIGDDTDWIGGEWLIGGLVLFIAGIALLVIAVAFRAWLRSRDGDEADYRAGHAGSGAS